MFERFTDRARRVVVLAQEEARLLNQGHIGTEHLLLGLIHEGEGVAARVLAGLPVELEPARDAVRQMTGAGEGVPEGHIPFTARAKKVLELSLREALELGHNYIGTEHLLLALLREGEGVGAQILRRMDADFGAVRQRVTDVLGGGAVVAAEPRPPVEPPTCPGCHSPLEGQLGWKLLEATGDATGAAAPVPVVYCRRCGRPIGLLGK